MGGTFSVIDIVGTTVLGRPQTHNFPAPADATIANGIAPALSCAGAPAYYLYRNKQDLL
jgi:hypothetical protein